MGGGNSHQQQQRYELQPQPQPQPQPRPQPRPQQQAQTQTQTQHYPVAQPQCQSLPQQPQPQPQPLQYTHAQVLHQVQPQVIPHFVPFFAPQPQIMCVPACTLGIGATVTQPSAPAPPQAWHGANAQFEQTKPGECMGSDRHRAGDENEQHLQPRRHGARTTNQDEHCDSPAWDIALGFLQKGQTEEAYQKLMSHDQLPREQVLRLMRVTGTCLHVVSAPTREKILRCCARLLDGAADNSEVVGELLPWMSQATQIGVLSPGG